QADRGRAVDVQALFELFFHGGKPLFRIVLSIVLAFRPHCKGKGGKNIDFFLRTACLFFGGMIE
ncbi:MAG: hypothetical protein IJL00_04330, partial [Clostridia bacterium]|nr:hypothetical protein [Clostridia bacterium]